MQVEIRLSHLAVRHLWLELALKDSEYAVLHAELNGLAGLVGRQMGRASVSFVGSFILDLQTCVSLGGVLLVLLVSEVEIVVALF